MNRVGLENGQITLKKAEETIGKEVFWQFPNDYRTMIDARNNGVPLIEQAPEGRDYAIDDLADQFAFERRNPPVSLDAKGSRLSGLFRLWPSKAGK